MALGKDIKILPLFLISIILPFLCYFVNYYSLKKDSSLHFLVDEGGIFHFIVISDYNFDGVNDEVYHRANDDRTVSTHWATTSGAVRIVETTAKGIGYSLDDTYCSIESDKSLLSLHLFKSVERVCLFT